MINIELQIALIAAGSAILGSLVPQIFAFFIRKEVFKDELRKDYKLNKVKTYQVLSEIIITMWSEDTLTEVRQWAANGITELEKFKLSYGIWLEDAEIIMINEVQVKLSDISAKHAVDDYEYKIEESLSSRVELLQSLCRNKIKEEYYIK